MPPFIWEGEGCGAGGYSVVPSAWSSVVRCHCFIYPDAFSQGRDEAHAKRLDGGGGSANKPPVLLQTGPRRRINGDKRKNSCDGIIK